jgi:hypothetical protein
VPSLQALDLGLRALSVLTGVALLDAIEAALRQSGEPMSPEQLRRTLEASVDEAELQAALAYLIRHEMVVHGGRGIQWTKTYSPSLAKAAAAGRRLAPS